MSAKIVDYPTNLISDPAIMSDIMLYIIRLSLGPPAEYLVDIPHMFCSVVHLFEG